MKKLIQYFPRQIAFPERVTVKNEKDFFSFFNKINKLKTKIYYSLYDCDEFGKFTSPKVDKIALDLDSDKSFDNIKKAHFILSKKNISHFMLFSTGGFWLYVFTKNYMQIKYKKDCLLNSIDWLINELDFTMGDEKICDTDYHCKDLPRVSRLPNSYDNNRKLFCIPICRDDLKNGFDYIKNKSKKQCFNFIYYGKEFVDMSLFDYKRKEILFADLPVFDWGDFKNDDYLIKDFNPCIKRILLEKDMDTYDNRWLFALYCHEVGLPQETCLSIAKKYFSRTKRTDNIGTNYDHFIRFKVADYAYSRNDFFPSCERLYDRGLCKGKNTKCGGVYR